MNKKYDQELPVGKVEQGALAMVGLFFLELIKVATIAGITIVLIRHFLFKPFTVKGESMEPTFKGSEYLIIDELTYRFREPARGEVIVFNAPVGQGEHYLKRVIGLPGERVSVKDNKVIVYNNVNPQGVVVKESYLVEGTPGDVTITLGADQYFVMGDNRDASYDSRRFGPISRDSILGRTLVRGWPFDRITTFSQPEYNF